MYLSLSNCIVNSAVERDRYNYAGDASMGVAIRGVYSRFVWHDSRSTTLVHLSRSESYVIQTMTTNHQTVD